MNKKYAEFSGLNLPAIEKEILQKWQANNAFEKSVSLKEGATPFVFYEGPPSANGVPGIHHVISRTLKDLVCRYKTMQGFQVKRKGGWDTHGLPVELGVEKELGITKEDIGKKISVEEYNKKCREAVLRYKKEWDDITTKMGYWVDLNNPYITFENNYIESLWWILKQLYNKNLLYESVSIQPYSPAAGTGLSSHELNQPGTYKDVKDTSATVMFCLPNPSKGGANAKHKTVTKIFEAINNSGSQVPPSEGFREAFFLAWTTTPWTLPSNLGLTVGANIDYVLVKTFSPINHQPINVILAKALLHKYFKAEGENADFENYSSESKIIPYKIIAEFKGKDLEGIQYEQLLPFEANKTDNPNAFKILIGDFVTTEDGTGIVHTAPAFGADDFRVGKKYDIGILTMVDRRGKFLEGIKDNVFLYGNEYVKEAYLTDAEKETEFKHQKQILEANGKVKDLKKYLSVDDRIVLKLQEEGKLFKKEKYDHNYPHCWRTDKPILYYPLDAWFIKTTALKDRMVELNKTINWKPKSTGEGRFGNWLENMVDWNLSRSRYWGTPLPVWRSENYYFFDDFSYPKELRQPTAVSFAIGSKKEFISTTFDYKDIKGVFKSFNVEGYLFDINLINEDLKKTESKIIERINVYNERLKKDAEINATVNVRGTMKVRSSIAHLFSIKLGYIQNLLKLNDQISLANIVDAGGFIGLFDEIFYKKIDEKNINEIDFHKPYIDNIAFAKDADADGLLFARVPDLVDVWFDSGAMPYAQQHFPFENKELFAQNYPADFIAEGVDQTRGWFYTLHAIGSLIKESVEEELTKAGLPTNNVDGRAYKTVVSNGLVLDKNGNKMSKRLGNVVNPFETIEKYGADATRWYLITNASPWDNLKFDIAGIQEVQRKFFGTLYNTYQFFVLYANVDGFAFKEEYIDINKRPEIDRWILSSLNTLIKKCNDAMDDYEPTVAGRLIEEFVDEHLSNWYVRLCRRRFWKGEYEADKIAAYQTLYECLETLVRLIAPISPFFSDAVFKNLEAVTEKHKAESVHHVSYPKPNEAAIDTDLEERMQLAQDASSLVLSLRKKTNIKVRQPLQKILIPVLNPQMKLQLEKVEDLIKAEVNVKEANYLTETEGIIKKKVKANFKVLGSKLGANMKEAANVIANFNQQQIAELEHNGSIEISILTTNYSILITDVEITAEDIPGWSVASKGKLTVALDITITDALQKEGNAREFINRVQNIRKESGFELTDRIFVQIQQNDLPLNIQNAVNDFKNYICGEILADSIDFLPVVTNGTDIEVNDALLKIAVTKKG